LKIKFHNIYKPYCFKYTMEDAFNVLIDYRSVFVALFMWIIIYAILMTRGPFKESDAKLNAGIAALAAIIVSLSGVVAYAVNYMFSLFGILIVAVFVIVMILSFLDIEVGSLGLNGKIVAGVLILIFLGILANAFFGVNNEFDQDLYNEGEYQGDVNTNPNIGFGEIEEGSISNNADNWFTDIFGDIDSATWSAFVFLVIIGIFVIVFAR